MPSDDVLRRVGALATRQGGVVTREQVLRLGGTVAWLDRLVRAGRWQRLLPAAVLTHSGPVEWRSRAWAALLHAGDGAALSHAAAGHRHGFVARAPSVVDVSVPAGRRVAPQPGLRVHRRRRMPTSWGSPAVVERGATVLDLTARAESTDDVVGVVTAAVRARTWPDEILDALADRARHPHRALLEALLVEVADGVESPLELRYRRDVERRHRLPRATQQVRQQVGGRWIRADALYEGLGVRTELDGELGHPGGRTASDVWRDNAVAVERGELTLRYRWHHVAVTPCETARQVEQALRSRGWSSRARPCSPTCPAGR